MKIGRTILTTIVAVIIGIALYKFGVKVYIGSYYDSYGTKAIIQEMIAAPGYMWGNVALLGWYILSLLNIWDKGEKNE